MINKLRFIGGWQLHPSIAVFAGLTLNVSVSQVRDAPDYGWLSFYDERGDDTQVQIWPGFVVGVQF